MLWKKILKIIIPMGIAGTGVAVNPGEEIAIDPELEKAINIVLAALFAWIVSRMRSWKDDPKLEE